MVKLYYFQHLFMMPRIFKILSKNLKKSPKMQLPGLIQKEKLGTQTTQ